MIYSDKHAYPRRLIRVFTWQFMGNICIQTFCRWSAKCRVRLDCPNARTALSLQTVSRLPYVGLLELLLQSLSLIRTLHLRPLSSILTQNVGTLIANDCFMLCIILEYLDADDWADNADLDHTVLRRSLIGLCSVCLYATSQLILFK